MGVLSHVLVPIASEEDATATCDALEPYVDRVDRITAVHVIEKAGGAIDKAPLEKRQSDAATFLAIVTSRFGSDVDVETRIAYGTDVVDVLSDVATDVGASAIAFHPRGGNRLVRLLSGDVSSRLVSNPDVAVVTLPSPTEE